MANKIQIKRSTSTATPASLNPGELAFSNATGGSGVLFIGSTDGATVVPIGGVRNPGVLTANQALVANATSYLDKVWLGTEVLVGNSTVNSYISTTTVRVGANVFLTTSSAYVGNSTVNSAITATDVKTGGTVTANGGVGSAGQILTSAGAGANAYWGAAPSGVTDITDSANATTVTIISSTGGDAVLDSANSTTAGILTSADWTKLNNLPANSVAGANTQVMYNNSGVLAGDAGFTFVGSTDALTLGGAAQTTAPVFSVANSTTSANLSSATLTIGVSVVNATAVAVGNSTVNATHTSSVLQVANATSTANLTATQLNVGANASLSTSTLFIGNTTVNSTATSSLVQVANSTGVANLTATQLNVGANANLSTTTLFIGNSTINATHTSSVLQVANSTSTSNLTATQLNVGANASLSTSALLVGNSTVNSVVTSTQISVGANVFANSSAFDVGNTIITTTNLTLGGQVTANGGVGSAGQVLTSGAAGNVYWTTPTDNNTTYDLLTVSNTTVGVVRLDPSTGTDDDVRFIGANGIIVTSDGTGNVTISTDSAGTGTFNNLTVAGNLTVSGTFTQLDVSTLTVEDPLIELARTQANTGTFVDTLDIGFYGQYGNTSNVVYTGLFRDQSDSGVYKLFSGQIPAPTTTVDTANVNFGYANLTIHSLNGGAAGSTIDGFALDGGTF